MELFIWIQDVKFYEIHAVSKLHQYANINGLYHDQSINWARVKEANIQVRSIGTSLTFVTSGYASRAP